MERRYARHWPSNNPLPRRTRATWWQGSSTRVMKSRSYLKYDHKLDVAPIFCPWTHQLTDWIRQLTADCRACALCPRWLGLTASALYTHCLSWRPALPCHHPAVGPSKNILVVISLKLDAALHWHCPIILTLLYFNNANFTFDRRAKEVWFA